MTPADIRKLAKARPNLTDWQLEKISKALRALADVLETAPRGLECNNFNHIGIGEFHGSLDPCKPLNRYNEALARVEAL